MCTGKLKEHTVAYLSEARRFKTKCREFDPEGVTGNTD